MATIEHRPYRYVYMTSKKTASCAVPGHETRGLILDTNQAMLVGQNGFVSLVPPIESPSQFA
jgi:hypothetical protein